MIAVVRRYFALRATHSYSPATCWRLALVDCGRYPA